MLLITLWMIVVLIAGGTIVIAMMVFG